MSKEHFEQWADFCRTYTKPMTELAELNTRTFNEIYSKSSAVMNNFANAKRPEEFVSSQIKFAIDTSACTAEYLQELLSILKNTATDATHQYGNYAGEAIKTGSAAFTSGKNKQTEK